MGDRDAVSSDPAARSASGERLAAVWFADIVGYTRLSAEDAPAALRLVEIFQQSARAAVERHHGRLVKFIGDAALAEFGSASAAVRAAAELQAGFAREVAAAELAARLRIGVHIGEVSVAADEDIYGDGVNIAARLQGAAEPGQLLVSDDVCRQLRRYPEFRFECVGEQTLRGVAVPITAYLLQPGERLQAPPQRGRGQRLRPFSALAHRRWIIAAVALVLLAGIAFAAQRYLAVRTAQATPTRLAVLPFDNLGPDQEAYFADGVTEEITDRLSSIGGLEVIANTSAKTYKQTQKPIRTIAEELGVEYLIGGSVRWNRPGGQGDSVEVTARLIRASDDTQVWKENYPVALASIVDVQSEIAERVASELDVVLLEPERRQLEARLTDDPRAYDAYLRGNSFYDRSWARADLDSAIAMYRRATELDPNFALAFAALGRAHAWAHQLRYDLTRERLNAAKVAVERAVSLDPELPEGHVAKGLYYYWGLGEYQRAIDEFEIAKRLQPSNAEAARQIGNVQRRQGLFDEAIRSYQRVVDLDPRSHIGRFNLGETQLFVRNYAPVEKILTSVNTLSPFFIEGYTQRARLALNSRGDLEGARRISAQAEERVPPPQWRPDLFEFGILMSPEPDQVLDRMRDAIGDANRWAYFDARGGHAWSTGRRERAGIYYDSARVELEKVQAREPDQAWVHAALGRA
ncbi:MAG: adenylate/guanylate cyclase domain-containing protein, partial [Longimicrobiaceae bacterium]